MEGQAAVGIVLGSLPVGGSPPAGSLFPIRDLLTKVPARERPAARRFGDSRIGTVARVLIRDLLNVSNRDGLLVPVRDFL